MITLGIPKRSRRFTMWVDLCMCFAVGVVDEIMIALLDAGERETVFTACGVLINLMIDEEIKPKLKQEDGIKK